MRELAELFFARAEAQSRGDANIGWETHRIPHPGLYDFIDANTSRLYEPLLSQRLISLNRALMRADAVGLNSATLFKQPARRLLEQRFQWHRDDVLRPSALLPMMG